MGRVKGRSSSDYIYEVNFNDRYTFVGDVWEVIERFNVSKPVIYVATNNKNRKMLSDVCGRVRRYTLNRYLEKDYEQGKREEM